MTYKFPNIGLPFSQYFTTEFMGSENLTVAEKKLIKNAGIKRQNDFSTGRFCARRALEKFGIKNTDILMGDGREPLWPNGIVGSISHSKKLTGAITGRTDEIVSVGLDIETIGGVKANMWELLFTKHEQDFLNKLVDNEVALFSTLLFSFKESFYKLQYPLTKMYLDFKDVEIQFINGDFKLYVNESFKDKMMSMELLSLKWDMTGDQLISVCSLAL